MIQNNQNRMPNKNLQKIASNKYNILQIQKKLASIQFRLTFLCETFRYYFFLVSLLSQ